MFGIFKKKKITKKYKNLNTNKSAINEPKQRTTTYGDVSELQREKSFGAADLTEPTYTSAKKYERTESGAQKEKKDLYRPGLDGDKLSSADIV